MYTLWFGDEAVQQVAFCYRFDLAVASPFGREGIDFAAGGKVEEQPLYAAPIAQPSRPDDQPEYTDSEFGFLVDTLNGLTEQETAASASVAGLSGAQPEALSWQSRARARRAFEDYVRSQWTSGYACPRTGDGYTDPKVDFAWRAVVALAAQPEAPAEPSEWKLNAITHVAAWLGDLQDVPSDASYWTNGRFAADCMDAHDVLLTAPAAQQPAELPEIDYDAAIKASGGKPGTWRCVSFTNGARWYRDTAIKAQGGSQ
jgi:hypothetical protein